MNAEFHGRIREDGELDVDVGRIDRPTKLNALEFDRSTGAGKRVEQSAAGSMRSDLQARVELLGTRVSVSFDRALETLHR